MAEINLGGAAKEGMGGKVLWMAVTADRYELPICVEKSRNALAGKLGVKPQTVSRALWREKRGIAGARRGYRIVTVREGEEPDG